MASQRPVRTIKAPKGFMDSESLIEAVRKRPCLWDKTYPLYRNRAETQKAWQAVASEFICESPINARKQWQAMTRARRNNYNERMRKEASGAEAHNLKEYIFEEKMSFMKLTPKNDKTEGNLKGSKEEEAVVSNEDEEDEEDEEDDDEGGSQNSDTVFDYTMSNDLDLHEMKCSQMFETPHHQKIKFSMTMSPIKDITKNENIPDLKRLQDVKITDNDIVKKKAKKMQPGKENALPSKGGKKKKLAQVVGSDDESVDLEEGMADKNHELHQAKAAQVAVYDAQKDLVRRKMDLAVAKARAEKLHKPTKNSYHSNTFVQNVQHDLAHLLNKDEDSFTHFCLSLVDRIKALSPRGQRRVQLELMKVLVHFEDAEDTRTEAPSESFGQKSDDQIFKVNADSPIVSSYGITLRVHDMESLRPGALLNDNIINFYFKLLESEHDGVYSFSTFFYGKLSKEGGVTSVSKWAKDVDWNELSVALIPIHIPGLTSVDSGHWVMAAINLTRRAISYYDSMSSAGNPQVFKSLVAYMTHHREDIKQWENLVVQGPRQTNGTDCGVFICQYAKALVLNVVPSFDQSTMDVCREYMVHEITHLKLLKSHGEEQFSQ